MSKIQKFFAFFGRIFISSLFLYCASVKMMDWQGSETFITNLICDWHASINFSPNIEKILETLLPYNTVILIVSIVLQILGAFLIFFGYQVRIGAMLLVAYYFPMMMATQKLWITDSVSLQADLIIFLNNLAIFGGLLLLLAFGEGPKQSEMIEHEEGHPFGKGI